MMPKKIHAVELFISNQPLKKVDNKVVMCILWLTGKNIFISNNIFTIEGTIWG